MKEQITSQDPEAQPRDRCRVYSQPASFREVTNQSLWAGSRSLLLSVQTFCPTKTREADKQTGAYRETRSRRANTVQTQGSRLKGAGARQGPKIETSWQREDRADTRAGKSSRVVWLTTRGRVPAYVPTSGRKVSGGRSSAWPRGRGVEK